MGFSVHLLGVRGSLPAPLSPRQVEDKVKKVLQDFLVARKNSDVSPEDFLAKMPAHERSGYGGHTACFWIQSPEGQLIIDGGSGIRRLGEQLMLGPCGLGRGEVHILMTHFHWDHLIGLPFFIPLFVRGNRIHFHSVQKDLEENIRAVFERPRFPVAFENLGAAIEFHHLAPRRAKKFFDLNVTPYQLDHPDPCWGYRVEHGGKAYAHCVDTECTRMSREEMGADVALYKGADVMAFDAQYTFVEASERVNWGHSSGPIGIDLALREGIRRVYMVHHDPGANDDKIFRAEQQTADYLKSLRQAAVKTGEKLPELEWSFAREGTVIEV